MLDKYIEVYYNCHRFRYWVQIQCLLRFKYQILSHTFFDILGTVGMFKIIGDLEKSFINSKFILRRKKILNHAHLKYKKIVMNEKDALVVE